MNFKFTRIVFFSLTFLFFLEGRATDYYLKSGASAITSTASWGVNTDGSGSSPSDFLGTSDVWHLANNTGISLVSAIFQAPSTATIIVESGFSFTVVGSSSQIACKLNVANGGTLRLTANISLNLGDLQTSSTVAYAIVPTGTVVAATYGNLTIVNNAKLIGNTSVNGLLTLSSARTLSLSGQSLSLLGNAASVAGTGSLTGDADAGITFQNGSGGNNGTINFANGAQILQRISLNFGSGSDYFTLGTNLSIVSTGTAGAGQLEQVTGGFDLNGKSFSTDAGTTLDFVSSASNGVIRGTSSSSLSIQGFIGQIFGSNILFMDGTNNSLSLLNLDASGQILSLGSAVKVNSVNVVDGSLELNNTGTSTFTSINVAGGAFSLVSGNADLINSIDIGTGAFFDVGNSQLTLKSTNAMTARIGEIKGTLTGNDITVETLIPGNFTGWANLGIHGVTGQNVKSWDTYSASAGTNGIPMTCNGCDYDENSLGSYFVSIQEWVESTSSYTDMVSTDLLTPGKGFWVYVGNGLTNTTDLTLVNTGPAVTGSQTVALTSSGTGVDKGFNLVANPYPSPISWTSVLAASGGTGTGLSDAIYVWNADLSSGSGAVSSYVSGVSSPGGAGSITDVIPAGQGFYVETSAATNLIFTESVKTTSNTSADPLLRPASSTGSVFRLNVYGSHSDWDAMAIRIHNDATAYFDKHLDAKKIFQSPGYLGYHGPYTHYTTISGKDPVNEDYSIQSIPPLAQSLSIPVLARGMATGSYTISATEFDDISVCITLKDKLTGATQDLKAGPYVFTMSDTTSTPRFELMLCKDGQEETGLSETSNANNSLVLINQDAQGAYVKTGFEKESKATISAYNLMGQKLMNDITVNGLANTTYLPLQCHNQVVFVTVSSDAGRVTKKILLH